MLFDMRRPSTPDIKGCFMPVMMSKYHTMLENTVCGLTCDTPVARLERYSRYECMRNNIENVDRICMSAWRIRMYG